MLSVIERYNMALDLLDEYDHQTMKKPEGNQAVYVLEYEECREVIGQHEIRRGKRTFRGMKRMIPSGGSIGAIYQTFGGEEVYPTLEEKSGESSVFSHKKPFLLRWK